MDKLTLNFISIFFTLYCILDSIEEQKTVSIIFWTVLLFLQVICFVINLSKL